MAEKETGSEQSTPSTSSETGFRAPIGRNSSLLRQMTSSAANPPDTNISNFSTPTNISAPLAYRVFGTTPGAGANEDTPAERSNKVDGDGVMRGLLAGTVDFRSLTRKQIEAQSPEDQDYIYKMRAKQKEAPQTETPSPEEDKGHYWIPPLVWAAGAKLLHSFSHHHWFRNLRYLWRAIKAARAGRAATRADGRAREAKERVNEAERTKRRVDQETREERTRRERTVDPAKTEEEVRLAEQRAHEAERLEEAKRLEAAKRLEQAQLEARHAEQAAVHLRQAATEAKAGVTILRTTKALTTVIAKGGVAGFAVVRALEAMAVYSTADAKTTHDERMKEAMATLTRSPLSREATAAFKQGEIATGIKTVGSDVLHGTADLAKSIASGIEAIVKRPEDVKKEVEQTVESLKWLYELYKKEPEKAREVSRQILKEAGIAVNDNPAEIKTTIHDGLVRAKVPDPQDPSVQRIARAAVNNAAGNQELVTAASGIANTAINMPPPGPPPTSAANLRNPPMPKTPATTVALPVTRPQPGEG